MFLARPVLCDSLIQNSSKKSDIIRTHMLCFGYRFCGNIKSYRFAVMRPGPYRLP